MPDTTLLCDFARPERPPVPAPTVQPVSPVPYLGLPRPDQTARLWYVDLEPLPADPPRPHRYRGTHRRRYADWKW